MMKIHHCAALLYIWMIGMLPLSAQEFGLASYYSDKYHGRETAYGDTYDKTKLTCSHKKHPYGTLLKVTRLDNNRSVTCRVIDKGPYTKGRIVDLSRAAAERIDLIKDGVVEVKVEVVSNKPKPTKPTPPPVAARPAPSQEDRTNLPQSPPPAKPKASPAPSSAPAKPAKPKAKARKTPEADPNKLVGQDYSKYGLYRIRVERGPTAGYGIQVMVVSDYEKAIKAIAGLQAQHFDDIFISVEPGQTPEQSLYKLVVGAFETEAEAQNYQQNLKSKYNIRGFVVNLEEKNPNASPSND